MVKIKCLYSLEESTRDLIKKMSFESGYNLSEIIEGAILNYVPILEEKRKEKLREQLKELEDKLSSMNNENTSLS